MEASEQTRLQKILKENGNKPKKHMTLLKDALAFLDKFKSSQLWLSKIRSLHTRKKYAKSLFRYCADVSFNPDELLLLKPTTTEIMAKMLTAVQEGKKPNEIAINEKEAERHLRTVSS